MKNQHPRRSPWWNAELLQTSSDIFRHFQMETTIHTPKVCQTWALVKWRSCHVVTGPALKGQRWGARWHTTYELLVSDGLCCVLVRFHIPCIKKWLTCLHLRLVSICTVLALVRNALGIFCSCRYCTFRSVVREARGWAIGCQVRFVVAAEAMQEYLSNLFCPT
jgi:hypothetical protein